MWCVWNTCLRLQLHGLNSPACGDSKYHSTVARQIYIMTSCRATAVWPDMNNRRSVLVHPTILSSTSATVDRSLSHILPRSPACLQRAGSQLSMTLQTWGIKSHTVWKDLQDGMERTIQRTTTGLTQETPIALCLSTVFPTVQHSSSDCRTGACRRQLTAQWHHIRNDASCNGTVFSK